MDLKNRITSILEYSGKNISEFSRYVGFKTPQAVRELIKGNTKTLSDSAASKILKAFPEINATWLMSDEGEMFKPSVENPKKENSKGKVIPFYDAESTGGYDGLVSTSDDAQLTGYIQAGGWFDGKETAAIRHVGDSMVEYPNGCILAVKEVTSRHLLVPGRNYVIETSEYRVTKRVQRGSTPDTIALYSSNEEKYEDGRLVHEPFEVEFSDIRRIYSVLGYIVNQSGEFRLIKP